MAADKPSSLRTGIHWMLLSGVAASGVLMAIGLVEAVRAGNGRDAGHSLIMLGILILIATPVMRVLVLGIGYAWRREWLYSGICAALLALIAFSAFLGS